MRLELLTISGFGALRDLEIGFHPRVTVIFGQNESGKSTLQRAVRAALFGLDAGGQGRAVERSDWSRWRPWSGSRYGIALSYALSDGRRFRVARRLDSRVQSVQVMELGGGDVTDELRSGRQVAVGLFHLGLSEPVFCATAWLGEDGLSPASPESAQQRAEEVQEAIERIVDTQGGVTAARAISLLREAMDRVGTERRLSSPLGVASSRLRDLDLRLSDARNRLAAVADDQARLRLLEASAAQADRRRVSAERAWLEGRLADLADRLRRLEECEREGSEQAAVIAATGGYAGFRTDDEDRVAALGVELNHAALAAAEAQKRWEASSANLDRVRTRRAEIRHGLQALGPTGPPVDERTVRKLHAELAAAAAGWARLDTGALIEERRAALRREIAATGFGDVRPEALEALAPLLEVRSNHRAHRALARAGALLAGCAAVAGGLLSLSHRTPAAVALAGLAALAAVATALTVLVAGRRGCQARAAQLTRLRHSGVAAHELERLADRLPSLRALQAALLREEALGESRRLGAEALEQEALAVYTACTAAALSGAIPPAPPPPRPATVDAYLDAARERLARLDAHVTAARRRDELIAEDGQLSLTEAAFEQVREEVQRTAAALEDGTQRLHRIVTGAGLPPSRTAAEAVAAFREACAGRRRHDEAVRAAEAIRRRAAVINADTHALLRSRDHFETELRDRGGDPAHAGSTPALDAEALRHLEMEAERARREAATALAEAKALRARLVALVDTVPDLADLEDQRNACAAARERGLRQLGALQRAVELIEVATRGAHRELAPRLAAALESRLMLLAGARYARVNVDTDHFAVSLLGADREQFTPLELTSQGTRDQVSLLLRVALCEVLGWGGEPAPLLLDEPLASSDEARRRAGLQFLHELSATTQVVITTNNLALVDELREAGGDDCAVVRLGPEMTVETVGRVAQRSPAMRTSPSSSETSSVNSGIRAVGTSPSRSSRAS